MSDPAAPAGRSDSWGGVLLPLVDMAAPFEVLQAIARVRNLAIAGVVLAFLVPKSALTGAESPERVYRTAGAFAVAAVVAHFVRRRAWGAWTAGGTIVAASLVAGPAPKGWAVAVAAVSVLILFATHVRRRFLAAGDPEPSSPGLAGIAWAVAGALIFREFVVLPIHVPTGSMQPAIYGARAYASGDYLGVDRTAYVGRDPRRWDIAVFDFPLHRPTEFVKRVIGLPGETVEIRDGDLWIDGRIARRPPLLQELMWREVFPRPSPLGEAHKIAQDWTAADRTSGAGWVVEGDGVKCTVSGKKESVLRFTKRLEQGDVRVRFGAGDAAPAAAWDAAVRIRSRGHVVEVRFGAGGSLRNDRLTVDGDTAASFDGAVPDEVAVADGLVVVRRRGVELARAEVPTDGPSKHGIELVAVAGAVAFRNLRVDQDQRWRAAQDGTTTWHVPDGHYFVLGDNSEQSEDSREWQVTELRRRDGSATIRYAPTYPDDTGAPHGNFRTDGADLVFTDVDGIPRRVRRDDFERPATGVPAPFVPRGHFLGRAALIFWPWAPAEGGFRPRILP